MIMKQFELSGLGLEEMSLQEQNETNGGALWMLAIGLGILVCGLILVLTGNGGFNGRSAR